MNTQTNFKLPADVRLLLERASAKTGASMTWIACEAIRKELAKYRQKRDPEPGTHRGARARRETAA